MFEPYEFLVFPFMGLHMNWTLGPMTCEKRRKEHTREHSDALGRVC